MSLADEYRRQVAWRSWPLVLDALPPLEGRTVLDLGCAVGDQAAALAARGARVIGIESNEELLGEARARGIANAEFLLKDLHAPLEIEAPVDGIWCSLTPAYFPDLPAALAAWTRPLRAGGWIALTEIDDLFAHEPLGARAKALLEGYIGEALAAGRYDFRMGRKLAGHLERAGFAVARSFPIPDLEFAFQGPARPDVLEAWRNRFARLKAMQDFCGAAFESVRDELLACLARPDHRSFAQVNCCIASL